MLLPLNVLRAWKRSKVQILAAAQKYNIMRRRVNGHYEEISPGDMEYIVRHINDTSRDELAKKFGISRQSIYKIVRQNNGIDRRKKFDIDDIVYKYYPNMSAREMAERFGHSKSLYIKRARQLGVKKSKEFLIRQQSNNYNALRAFLNTEEGRKKVTKSIVKMYRMERFRVDSGMKQKTRIRLRKYPKKYRNAMRHLVVKRGYIQSEDDKSLFFRDENTKRSREEYFTKKYKFKFEQYENEECT